jgi:hypothetical protein
MIFPQSGGSYGGVAGIRSRCFESAASDFGKACSRKKSPQELVDRSRIVLMSAKGINNVEQAIKLGQGVDRALAKSVGREGAGVGEGAGRGGKRSRFGSTDLRCRTTHEVVPLLRSTAEPIAAILAVACEPPEDSVRPESHWIQPELTREVIKRGIVESISARHVDRFLKGGGRSQAAQEQVLDGVKGQARGP